MAYAGRMFRVFVSSTFSDLQAERDALQKEVFPKLRILCRKLGARFQAVDLRWGVSEEASLDQQSAIICLNEIARCQQVSPRPNFLVLLGDRYGSWLPPTSIPSSEFAAIYQCVSTSAQQQLDTWYRQDNNAVPVEYCLLPRTGVYIADDKWVEAARTLHTTFLAGIEHLPEGSYHPVPYLASITEQEILAGVLDRAGASDQACCFFRRISNLEEVVRDVPTTAIARSYVDLDQSGTFDTIAHGRLEDLKGRLQACLPRTIYDYETRWTGSGLAQDYLAQFCHDVYTQLKQMIEEELDKEQAVVENDHEVVAHRVFAEERGRHFTGRADTLAAIECYIAGIERFPLVVHGDSGVGKSALMAQAIKQAQHKHPTTAVITRFAGATPASMDERTLLQSLCRQISQMYKADETTIPTTLEGLVQEFPRRLALATEQTPLVLFLDALDQLGGNLPDQDALNLTWLPVELPLHVRLVVSAASHADFTSLSQHMSTRSLLRLEPMPLLQGETLLDIWLADAQRTLQEWQKQEILSRFADSGLPLYLKLAFEEARRWKSYTPFVETHLASDIPGLLNQLFDRLSLPTNYGAILVKQSLGYLGAAKEGLTEDEMLDLLSLDHQVLEDIRLHSPRSPKVDRLPNVIWSRLFFDLEPYLTERVADGASLMTFYHRQLASAVADRYLSREVGREYHRGLADYFLHSDGEPLTVGEPIPNLRKLAELPYQQTLGELWSELSTTLTDLRFLAEKSLYVDVWSLETDLSLASSYHQAYGVKPAISLSGSPPTREPTLPLFKSLFQIIGRISHLLQQAQTRAEMSGLLLSYLGWEPAFASRRISLEQDIPRPFLTAWHPLPERSSSVLLRTLIGHAREVTACAFSSDSHWIVSASNDRTLRVWNASSGARNLSFIGHAREVTGCAFSPDGRSIVSASNDKTLKVWNAATGTERFSLIGHTNKVRACAFSPDGRSIISASDDKTLKVWDVSTGAERLSLIGHVDKVTACVFSPDGRSIISASNDKTLKIWDTATGTERLSFTIGRSGTSWFSDVMSCAISPDGRFIVSAAGDSRYDKKLKVWDAHTGAECLSFGKSTEEFTTCTFSPDSRWILSASDKTLKIWDAATGVERISLSGHTAEVTACVFSPDGRSIVSASNDNTLKVWDITSEIERISVIERFLVDKHPLRFSAVASSPDERWMAHPSSRNTLEVRGQGSNYKAERFSLIGHSAMIMGCAFSPDGRSIVSSDWDGIIKIWDVATRTEYLTFGIDISESKDRIMGCVFSPDGRSIVTTTLGGMFKIWDAASGVERISLIGHTRIITTCAFSPDGRSLVSTSNDKTLKVWDLTSGVERLSLTGHTEKVTACAYSPDGRWIVSASDDETCKVWDAASGSERISFTSSAKGITACAFSADGRWIVSVSGQEIYKVWDASSGKELLPLAEVQTASISACAYSADGRSIVSASDDGTLQIWNATSGREQHILMSHESVEKIMFYNGSREKSPHPTLTDLKDLIRMGLAWNATSDKKFPELSGLADEIWAYNILKDEKHALLPSLKDMVKLIWDDILGKKHTEDEWFHTRSVTACAFSPNGRSIVTASRKGTLRIWKASSCEKYRTLPGHTDEIMACAYSPDGRSIVTISEDEKLKIWDASSGKVRLTFTGHTSWPITAFAFSPDSRFIVSASMFEPLKVWDASSGVERLSLVAYPDELSDDNFTHTFNACAYSPDGRFIVAASDDESLKVWDATSGVERSSLVGHTSKINSCAVHPYGRLIVSVSSDSTLKVWDLHTGTCLLTFPVDGELQGCAFHPDGEHLVTWSSQGVYFLRLVV